MRHTVVIGDIHGMSDLLTKLLENIRARFGTDVDIFHVGDLVDRGPNSKEVVQLCIDNNIQGILGNHELWLHQFLSTGVFDPYALHSSMKGAATLGSYNITVSEDPHAIEHQLQERFPRSHREYILNLPVTRKIESGGKVYRLIHTGLKRSTAEDWVSRAKKYATQEGIENVEDALMDVVADQTPASILWTGNSWKDPQFYHFKDGSIQILGHSPTPRGVPLITNHWIAVDCGCGVRRSVLACVVLGTHEVISTNMLATKGVSDAKGFTDFTM